MTRNILNHTLRSRLLLVVLSLFFTVYIIASSVSVYAISAPQRRLIDSGVKNFSIEEEKCRAASSNVPLVPDPVEGSALASAQQVNAFTGTQIEPSAIILHWTAGEYDTPEELVATLRSRDRSVQLTIDKQGKVYQLSQTLETRPHQSMADDEWNDVSIGVEIESGNFGESDFAAYENDLLSNEVQYQKVLEVVKDLMDKYNIPNESDTNEKRGVFGHLEANASSRDPGANYMKKVRDDLKSTADNVYDPTVGVKSGACVCSASSLLGSGGSGSADVPKDFTLGPLENGELRRVNLIKALMADFGLTAEQASGPVGNFMAESGGTHLPPDINENQTKSAPPKMGNAGYGWAQWSFTRHSQFINYAIENGYMQSTAVPATDAANYAFFKYELNNGYKVTIEELKKQSTPEDAAVSFEATYEKAGVVNAPLRSSNARQAFEEYQKSGGSAATPSGSCGSTGTAAIIGDDAFPLITTKTVLNGPQGNAKYLFSKPGETAGGHDYSPHAHDIYAPPGTPIAAFAGGTVTRLSKDKCPGRSISIWNEEADTVVWYAHLDFEGVLVKEGDKVVPGQQIGVSGTAAHGCGTPHLHIDASRGKERGSCKRGSCPAEVREKFVKIGDKLYELYQLLPN